MLPFTGAEGSSALLCFVLHRNTSIKTFQVKLRGTGSTALLCLNAGSAVRKTVINTERTWGRAAAVGGGGAGASMLILGKDIEPKLRTFSVTLI